MNQKKFILNTYKVLFSYFGKQHWWPGDTKDEIIIGAVLTQNTSWKNVEKAITELKKHECISLSCIYKTDREKLASLIKSAGFYRQKSSTLKSLSEYLTADFNEDIKKDHLTFRKNLLKIKGIGKETADSILLYAFDIPVFVIDTYTKRMLLRHGVIEENADYDSIQSLFHQYLPRDAYLYNEFHALFVKLGKEYCLKKSPKCDKCPIKKGG